LELLSLLVARSTAAFFFAPSVVTPSMVSFGDLVALYGIPTLGVVLSVSIYASSFAVVRRARTLRNIEQLDAPTLTIQFLNAQAWVEYARVIRDPFIWTSNTVGLVLTTFYVATVLELAVANGKLAIRGKVEVIYALGMVVVLALTTSDVFISDDPKVRAMVSGTAANAFSILMCLAPALNIYTACRQRSAACIQIGLNVASLACNLTWTIYGLLKHNPFIYVGCMIALASAVAQLATVLMFLRSDRAKRQHLAKKDDLHKLKAAAVEGDYAKQYGRGGKGYVPLDFNSEYLQQRLALRAEAGHSAVDAERHETTTTALMGVPIQDHLADVVLQELAKDSTEMAVVVKPSVPSEPTTPSEAHEAVQQLMQRLQSTSDVEYRQVDDGQGPHAVYAISILPKGDKNAPTTPLAKTSSYRDDPAAAAGPVPTIELQLGRGGHFTISRSSLASDADLRASIYKPISPGGPHSPRSPGEV